jgi:hypothetical protein
MPAFQAVATRSSEVSMRILRTGVLCLALSCLARPVSAGPIVIDFEGLVGGDPVTDQLAALGVTFSGAQALSALDGSYNEFDFPPLSGSMVVMDSDPGGIRVDFAPGATSVSGHFTYLAPLTMTAYAGAAELGSVTSTLAENYTSSGNPANELLQLAFATSITHVILTTGFGPQSFTLDDFAANIVEEDVTTVPEPASATLLLIGAAAIAGWRRRQTS